MLKDTKYLSLRTRGGQANTGPQIIVRTLMTRQGGYFASKMCFIASLMKHIIVLKVPRLLWTFNYRLQYIFDSARKFSAMIILFLAFSIIQIEIP